MEGRDVQLRASGDAFSVKNKEEGEVTSSSDDDERPCHRSSQLDDRSSLQRVRSGSAPVKRNIQHDTTVAKSVPTNSRAGFVGQASRSHCQPHNRKKFEKNRTPFVISFSDDDSGSESEEHRQKSTYESRNETHGVVRSRRPPAASSSKVHPGNTRKEAMLPRKVSPSRTSVSSMMETGRLPSRNGGHVKSIIMNNKSKAEQEHEGNQNIHLNSSKLQDLRQLIAIRENELKRKVNKKKESPSSSCKADSATNLSSGASKMHREAHDDFVQYELKEPDRKRLKFEESHACPVKTEHRQGVMYTEPTLVSENVVLEKSGQQLIDNRCSYEKTVLGTSQCQRAEKNVCAGDDSNVAREGTSGITDVCCCNHTVQLAGPIIAVNAVDTSNNTPHIANLGHPVGMNHQSPSLSGNKTINEFRPANKAVEPVRKDAQASRSNLNNNFTLDNLNVSGTTNMDLQGLMEIEELHDKELEDAQEYRHKCELEERTALKAYRRAQRATMEANSRCAHLYRNRELFSAQLRSLMMDNPNMIWSSRLDDQRGEGPNSFNNLHIVPSRRRVESELYAHNHGENVSAVRSANVTQPNVSGLEENKKDFAINPSSEPDTSMFWSASLHNHTGEGLVSLKDPEVNMRAEPSGQQTTSRLCAHHQCKDEGNVRSANAFQQKVYKRYDRQALAVDPSSEPNTSTSEPEDNNADVNAAGCQSSDSNMSAEEEDEAFLIEHEIKDSNLENQREEVISGEHRELLYDESRNLNSSQDSLLLEASLRSQLFARLGVNSSLNKRGLGQKINDETESRSHPGNEDSPGLAQKLKDQAESSTHDGNEDSPEPSTGNLLSSDAKKDLSLDLGGNAIDRTLSELPLQIKANCYVEKSSNFGSTSTALPLDNKYLVEVLYPVLKSAFVHMKAVDVVSSVHLHTESNSTDPYTNVKNSSDDSHYEIESISSNSIPREETSVDSFKDVGFYSCNHDIDPLWPLCMYELRGKCNDDECPWQHVRDHSRIKLNIDNAIEDEGLAAAPGMMTAGAVRFSKSLDLLKLTSPSYLVCLDMMKADLRVRKSVLGQSEASCWQKSFSATLVLSSLLPMGLLSGEPFLHGPGARIESYGSWNRQSSYFHSIQGMIRQNQPLVDNDESLDIALVILSQEANKQKGRIEALKVLARALEADSKSAVLWIVYLHIYYCNQKSIGKDDMFKYAVEHNRGSYELWLMYINSREQLEDRFFAYDASLSALSHNASPDKDAVHASECILDIFLQMMNTLCLSGKVGKALEKLHELFPSKINSCELYGLSEVVACLTVRDKCIFWVCCAYLILYKKLPDAVVSQFECQKELLALEWVSTQLTLDEKQQAVSLLEMAENSLELDIDSESHQSETAPKARHMFALNHIRCVAVLEGLECSRNLLDRYMKLYPSCLGLALVAARAHELASENTSFDGFERALNNWPEDVPGVQCLWNQYVEYALQSGRVSYVQTLMDRWYHSVWRVKRSQHEIVDIDTLDGEKSSGSQNSDAHFCNPSDIDRSFGLLNFSIYKLLQNDRTGAHSAIDRALKCASAKNYKHCVREHAMFLLTNGSQLKDTTPASKMLNFLEVYLANSYTFPTTELLSRKFIQTIKKSRVQQLVSNLFYPVSSDISLVNLVLQVCYGPLLLPQTYDKLTDIVDLVESLMEIFPANYELAISVGKLLSRASSYAVVGSSVSFWASSILVNALFNTVPVAPEYVWVEAANVLHDLEIIQPMSLSFHKRALEVYPFSMKLWNSYLTLCKTTGPENAVKSEAARRGIELD
ncbi:hypothetical protein ACET3Z_029139 [Daucus carota]